MSAADRSFDRAALEQLLQQCLDEARARGATETEASIGLQNGLTVTVRMGAVETIERHRDKGVGVTVWFGRRKGSASGGDFSPAGLRDTVRAACDIAQHTAEDQYAGLAPRERMAWDYPDLDLDHPWALPVERAVALATECEAAARAVDRRIVNSEGADASSHRGLTVYANSHGFVGAWPASRHALSCAVVGEQEGAMQRDSWYTVARDPARLESAVAVGRRAGERTVARLGARRLSTRAAPVLFAAETAGGLFGALAGAVNGGRLYRKSSFLLNALGEQLFPPFMRIHERPHLPGALGSAPFDDEGVATGARDLVRDGVLQGYVLNSYAARRLGLESTGNAGGVHNLRIDSGALGDAPRTDDAPLDQAALLREMGTGLLVAELIGSGVNLTTGDYSRGAAGFWVEGGEIRYPVEEITIAGNLREMFRAIRAVGDDVERRGNIQVGSTLIERMSIGGT